MSIEIAQKNHAREVHARLVGKPESRPTIDHIERAARQRMKELLDAQLEQVHIVPRGRRKLFTAAIVDEDGPLAKQVFSSDTNWREDISAIILDHGETIARVKSDNRDVNIVACRRAISINLRNRGWSLTRIGTFLNRDHTSIRSMILGKTRK